MIARWGRDVMTTMTMCAVLWTDGGEELGCGGGGGERRRRWLPWRPRPRQSRARGALEAHWRSPAAAHAGVQDLPLVDEVEDVDGRDDGQRDGGMSDDEEDDNEGHASESLLRTAKPCTATAAAPAAARQQRGPLEDVERSLAGAASAQRRGATDRPRRQRA